MSEAQFQINIPLLRKVLDHITEHPEEWEQDLWAMRRECGTSFCVAGHAAVMAGHQIRWDDGVATHTTEHATIRAVATRELGLTNLQSLRLFNADNTLPELWAYACSFTDGEIQLPEGIEPPEGMEAS